MKVIITGSTGMLGKAVLIECIESSLVSDILVINRRSINESNPKVKELIVNDYSDLNQHKNDLKGYDACYHCMGISALGKSEAEYTRVTFTHTKTLIDILYHNNPQMLVCYVSGMGTQSNENHKTMWVRVKAKTENYILNKGFKDAYAYRPGFILPEKGVKAKTTWYRIMYNLVRPFSGLILKSEHNTRSSFLGKSMLALYLHPLQEKIIYGKQINQLASKL